tara:strand:+ start:4461 stop:5168 length:708 start_codon:yes stop_codon:yes gene_type:complete
MVLKLIDTCYMGKIINTLIIEDEQLIIDAMINALNQLNNSDSSLNFKSKVALNCDSALKEIDRAMKTEPLDLVLLDISIPMSADKQFLSGEDIGIKIKENFPCVKIIVFTFYNNNYRLNNILKSLNPGGFIIKTELNFSILMDAISTVVFDTPYYSKAILKLLRRHIMNDFTLDKIDRQLLYQLSKGAKMSHLTEIIPLSVSALESRKRRIKDLFGIDDNDDRKLILKAEQCGFL